MTSLLALAFLLAQFTHEVPKYAVLKQPEVRYSVQPEVSVCNLVPPFKLAATMAITVDVKGNPQHVHITKSSGNKCFDQQTVAAGNHYRFAPALKEGHPILSAVTIGVTFGRDREKY